MKYISLVLFAAMFVTNVAFAQPTTVYTDLNKSYKEGVALYDKGLFGPAQQAFSEVLVITRAANDANYDQLESNAELYYAKCAVRLEKPEGEKLILDFIREHDPDPIATQATIEMANYYYNSKSYDEAIRFFNMIQPSDLTGEQRSEVLFKSGYCYFVKKKFSTAKSKFEKTKDVTNNYYYPSNYYYGMTCFFDGDYDCAIKSFQLVESSRKYKPLIPYYISQIYFAQGKMDELIAYGSEKVEDLSVKNRKDIHHLLGQAYFERGDYDAALPHLEYHAEHSRKMRVEDFYQVAYTQYKSGVYDGAIENFKELNSENNEMGQKRLV